MRLVIALLALAFAGAAACLIVAGPLPGDVALTQALQSLLGPEPHWAGWMADTAVPPLLLATVALGAGLGWLAGAPRAGLAVPLALALGFAIERAMRALIFAPRPGADLVAVASASTSSGLPSTFGVFYASIFGVVLLAGKPGPGALVARIAALALIIIGSTGRIVLGGHWPSQMLVSLAIGVLAAAGGLWLADRPHRVLPRKRHG